MPRAPPETMMFLELDLSWFGAIVISLRRRHDVGWRAVYNCRNYRQVTYFNAVLRVVLTSRHGLFRSIGHIGALGRALHAKRRVDIE